MPRWTSLLGAFLLVLMLWTGGVAHAAKRADCGAQSTETRVYAKSDQDQVPPSSDQDAAHHNAGCSAHHVAAPTGVAALAIDSRTQVTLVVWRESGVPGRGPGNQLRPPIA